MADSAGNNARRSGLPQRFLKQNLHVLFVYVLYNVSYRANLFKLPSIVLRRFFESYRRGARQSPPMRVAEDITL